MKVLVDYRNVPTSIRGNGLKYLADKIATGIIHLVSPPPHSLDIRLYSGWDRNQVLTQEAQRLYAEGQQTFPAIRNAIHPITMTVELVHTLEVAPRKRLSNKLRSEPLRNGVRFRKPSLTTCRNASCPIDCLYDFFRTGHCSVTGCAGTVGALAEQESQKLVDTMLVADMIYLSNNSNDPICLVGSDDDMWPGILSALSAGRRFIHLQTKTMVGNSPYLIPNLGVYEQRAL
jgi:hypothetical protein